MEKRMPENETRSMVALSNVRLSAMAESVKDLLGAGRCGGSKVVGVR